MAAPTESTVNAKQAVKLVTAALKLDSEGRNREAYQQYLQCMHHIARILLEESYREIAGIDSIMRSKKLLTLHQQCSERVKVLLEEMATIIQSVAVSMPGSISSSTPSSSSSLAWDPGDEVKNELASLSVRDLTPLELAQRNNQQLMNAYVARVARIRQTGGHEAAELSLTLQRKMAENMAVAEARQQALARKMQERQGKLKAEATRRFASSTGMYKDEQERRIIYTKVMEFEQDRKSLQACRKRMSQQPLDLDFTQRLIKQITKTADHPLMELLVEYRQQVYDRIQPLLSRHEHQLQRVYNISLQPREKSISSDAYSGSVSHSASTDDVFKKQESLDSQVGECKDSRYKRNSVSDIDEFDDLFEDDESMYQSEDGFQRLNVENQTGQHRISNGSVNVSGDNKAFAPETEEESHHVVCDNEGIDEKIDCLDANVSEGGNVPPSRDSNTEKTVESSVSVEHLNRDALSRHAHNIVRDVQDNLERLQTMFVVAYEQLDNPEGRDLCYACLEEPFFTPIWAYLLALFRLANGEEERKLLEVMSQDLILPGDFKVKQKYWLHSDEPVSCSVFPYQHAVLELQQLVHLVAPLSKLECIVRVTRAVCTCVQEYYTARGEKDITSSIGADDLLPILCYVVVKCGQAQLVSELRALEEITHECYLMGEEGYCLTSLQTALGYVLTLTNS